MSNNFVWGTHTECFALSLYFGKPMFVALNKGEEYYWAKYMCRKQDNKPVVFQSHEVKLPADLSHFEVCHVNDCHYDVILSADGSIPHIPPYTGDASTSAPDSIVIT